MKTYVCLIGMLISLSLFSQDYTQVYLIGGAVPNGWQNDKAEAMTLVHADEESAVFTWSGALTDSDFKFINALNTWQPSFNAPAEDEVIELGATHNLVYNESGNDYKFKSGEAGVYKVTVDLKKLTMVVESLLDELWISGSSIPGSPVKLTKTLGGGGFIYGGELYRGEFKVQTTEQPGNETIYLVPVEEYTDVTGETAFQMINDPTVPGWEVIVDDPAYKIKFDFGTKKSTAKILLPSDKIYMIGGASLAGWDTGKAIEFARDENNPGLYIFDGELKVRTENVESNLFKILGQKGWNPNSLHPSYENEPIMTASYYMESTDGSFPDYKWMIDESQQGRYIIKVNVLTERIEAEFLGDGSSVGQNNRGGLFRVYASKEGVYIEIAEPASVDSVGLFDLSGRLIERKRGSADLITFNNQLSKGIYVVTIRTTNKVFSEKVVVR